VDLVAGRPAGLVVVVVGCLGAPGGARRVPHGSDAQALDPDLLQQETWMS
jgi:hypothetical protein